MTGMITFFFCIFPLFSLLVSFLSHFTCPPAHKFSLRSSALLLLKTLCDINLAQSLPFPPNLSLQTETLLPPPVPSIFLYLPPFFPPSSTLFYVSASTFMWPQTMIQLSPVPSAAIHYPVLVHSSKNRM